MMITEEIRAQIDRLIEILHLEGRSSLELPGQFAYVLWRNLRNRAEWEELVGKAGQSGLDELVEDVHLIHSATLQNELKILIACLLKSYPDLVKSVDNGQVLAPVMDYMLEAISLKEGKGIIFTPANIAELMVKLVKADSAETFWDPACGSGTLLVQAAKERAGRYPADIQGSEINEQMVRIAGLNAFFHGISPECIHLEDSRQKREKFDVIVANPPVVSAFGVGQEKWGDIVPTSAAHLQFLQLIPQHLNDGGRAAVLINENVLFSVKQAERGIRRMLVEKYGLRAVFSLPKGTFMPYTSAKSSLLFFGAEPGSNKEILFYELKTVGYTLDKKRRPLKENDIPDALEVSRRSEEYYEKWVEMFGQDTAFNMDGIPVPAQWQESRFWFADRETVRENDYCLLPAKYRPLGQEEQARKKESCEELLERLFELQKETDRQLKKLGDVFYGDWR